MPPAVGPILRILGLMIELLGITLLMLSGRKDGADVGARLGIPTNQVWAVVFVGFALWAAGTMLIYAQRFRRLRKEDEDLDRES